MMVDIRECRDHLGHSPFGEWVDALDAQPAQKVARSLYRMGLGNFSNVKGVGSGVFEYRINFGPGYRVYFGKDGEEIVILLGGGTSDGSKTISRPRSPAGKITNRPRSTRKQGNKNGTDD